MNRMITLEGMDGVPRITASIRGKRCPMRGLTKPLRTAFYPRYRPPIDHAAADPWLPPDRSQLSAARKRRLHGASLGTRVDEELRLYVNNPLAFAKRGRSIQRLTSFAIAAFRRWHWTPAISQFPIAAPDIGIGTRVDLICIDRHYRPVLIEFKTATPGYFAVPQGTLAPPFATIDSHPLHHAILQVLLEKLIIQRYWGFEFPGGCFVVQDTPNGVARFGLPPWASTPAAETAAWKTFSAVATAT
jgi:hypothetical protein